MSSSGLSAHETLAWPCEISLATGAPPDWITVHVQSGWSIEELIHHCAALLKVDYQPGNTNSDSLELRYADREYMEIVHHVEGIKEFERLLLVSKQDGILPMKVLVSGIDINQGWWASPLPSSFNLAAKRTSNDDNEDEINDINENQNKSKERILSTKSSSFERNYYTAKMVPSLIGKAVIEVSCGKGHVAVVTKDGSLYTWGDPSNGRLGQYDSYFPSMMKNNSPSFSPPQRVKITLSKLLGNDDNNINSNVHGDYSSSASQMDIEEIKSYLVCCGDAHTFVATEAGLVCFGAYGPWLGTGISHLEIRDIYEPTLVPLERSQRYSILSYTNNDNSSNSNLDRQSRIQSIACGKDHTLVCTVDGKLYAWGEGEAGKLGHIVSQVSSSASSRSGWRKRKFLYRNFPEVALNKNSHGHIGVLVPSGSIAQDISASDSISQIESRSDGSSFASRSVMSLSTPHFQVCEYDNFSGPVLYITRPMYRQVSASISQQQSISASTNSSLEEDIDYQASLFDPSNNKSLGEIQSMLERSRKEQIEKYKSAGIDDVVNIPYDIPDITSNAKNRRDEESQENEYQWIFLLPDHTTCWRPRQVVLMKGYKVIQVSAGDRHSVVVVEEPLIVDGVKYLRRRLFSFGSNSTGQLAHTTCTMYSRDAKLKIIKSDMCSIPAEIKQLRPDILGLPLLFKYDSANRLRSTSNDDNGEDSVCEVGILSVSCGSEHTAAIASDGSLLVWGNVSSFFDDSQGIAAGPTPRLVLICGRSRKLFRSPMKISYISCGSNHILCITADGRCFLLRNNRTTEILTSHDQLLHLKEAAPNLEMGMDTTNNRNEREHYVKGAIGLNGDNEFQVVLLSSSYVSPIVDKDDEDKSSTKGKSSGKRSNGANSQNNCTFQ